MGQTKRIDYTGRETTYEYDVLNRLKKINYLQNFNGVPPQTPIATATYNYDDLSRLVSAINEAGTVSFTYDNRGRLKTETDVFGHVTERVYDAASRRTQLKLDGNVHTAYNYDNADRLTTLTDEASQNFTFAYDIANRLTSRTMPNGITSTFEYDGMSRLTRLKHQSTSATLFDNQYGYNSANQISQIVELTQTKNFTYDNIDRLTSMTNGSSNESYVFDGVGNRTSSHRSATYGYQPFNRLTSTATTTQNLDANGNTVSKSEGSNFWRYVWDYENRLATASNRKQTVRYAYDALDRRVRRNLANGKESTKFIYDNLDVVADDSAGTLTKYQNGLGIDDKLKVVTTSTSKYFLVDHLGSTNALTSSSGSITESNSYDSFGNASNTNFPSRYQFTGREYDSFTGLQFSRARWYDPNLGRFISEDPIGFNGGDVNLYGYVKNRPIYRRDPLGLDDADIAFRETDLYKDLERQGRLFWQNYKRGPECGPAGSPVLEFLVPDSVGIFRPISLTGPCISHDACYGICGKPKEECDTNLGNDIFKTCLLQGGLLRECEIYANAYNTGVSLGGGNAFRSAQSQSACPMCIVTPPPRPRSPSLCGVDGTCK